MIGKTLFDLRKENSKTQKEVALFLKISQQAYANYESSKREPDIETISKIADYFNCSVDYLLGKTETKKAPLQLQESLTTDEQKLLNYFKELNDEGQYLLINQAQALVTSGLYIKNKESKIHSENLA